MSTRLKKIFYGLSIGGTFFGLLAVTRGYMSGNLYTGNEEMFGKTVIVTGANKGIGKETARNLAKRGARVILACKDMKSCAEAKEEIIKDTFNKNVDCLECDLASLDSIKNFVSSIEKNEKHLDVLVNNAGVMWCPKKYTKEGFEYHLGVNHLGHFYLTNLLLPKLIESKPSRIIVVACRDYQKGSINFDDLNSSSSYDVKVAYNQSKLAEVMSALELADRVRDKGVSVVCVDPGYVHSDLMRYSSVYKSPYSPVSLFFKAFLKTPLMGAQSVVFASVREDVDKLNGSYIRDFRPVEISENALDKAERNRLWATSEKWTRLK